MPRKPSILDVPGNPRELQQRLKPFIGKKAASKIEIDLKRQARRLYILGKYHFNFARRQALPRDWRQVVSRAYYAAYSVSRAIRLMETGEFSRDVKDHQRFDRLPNAFRQVAMYSNKLELMRDDRNICDYDHSAQVSDLTSTPPDTLRLVAQFMLDAKAYLLTKGLKVK